MSKTKDNNINMTEGVPAKLLIAFAIPMMIGNIFQQLYNVVDSAIVGRLIGSNALAAIGAPPSALPWCTYNIFFIYFLLSASIYIFIYHS